MRMVKCKNGKMVPLCPSCDKEMKRGRGQWERHREEGKPDKLWQKWICKDRWCGREILVEQEER
jgi:hypothetical protein